MGDNSENVGSAGPATAGNNAVYASMDVSELQLGVRLNLPIHDERMVLLLSAGQVISETFLEHIHRRGLLKVTVHASELPRLHAGKPQGASREVPEAQEPPACTERNDLTDEFDELLRNPAEMNLPPQKEAFSAEIARRGAERFDEKKKQDYVERQNASVGHVDQVFDKLLRGKGLDLDGLSSIADEALADLKDDMDLFVSLGVNPHNSGYPARHSLHTCMLALAVGSQLKLDRATLKELGVGCLIHDSGMLMIDQSLAASPHRLRSSELLEISKHPVRVFDKMLGMLGVSKRSAYIAYQMHERPDGSGYPRQRKKDQIHFLSRIAAVADVYVALAAPRPFRQGILPHKALQTIVQAGGEGRLDQAAAQALLRTLSAYPLGSYVQLSDGRVGTVIRSNDMQFERPVVETWPRDGLNQPAVVVDLAAEQELKILGPLASLTSFLESELCDAEMMRNLMGSLHSALEYAGGDGVVKAGSANRAFQTYVTVYVPVTASHSNQLQWRRVTGVSRDLAATGMAVVSSDEIRSPMILIAFNVKAGVRICVKAVVERRELLPKGLWQYDLTFRGKVTEPQISHAIGKV